MKKKKKKIALVRAPYRNDVWFRIEFTCQKKYACWLVDVVFFARERCIILPCCHLGRGSARGLERVKTKRERITREINLLFSARQWKTPALHAIFSGGIVNTEPPQGTGVKWLRNESRPGIMQTSPLHELLVYTNCKPFLAPQGVHLEKSFLP